MTPPIKVTHTGIPVTFDLGAFTGGSAVTTAVTVRRVDKILNISIPEFSGTTNANSASMSTSGTPLASYSPIFRVIIPIATYNGAGATGESIGSIVIGTDGSLSVRFNSEVGVVAAGSNPVGFRGMSLTYPIF